MKKNKRRILKIAEFKLKVVLDVIENQRSVAEVAIEIGVHRKIVYNWLLIK